MLRSGRSLSGHERNCCFLNTGGGRFADVSAAAGLDFIDDGRVLALADWDFDGDVDFWIANRSGPQVRYLRNDVDGHNNVDGKRHFAAFSLEGVQCNRDAIGARVTLHFDHQDLALQSQTLRGGEGYLSQSSKWLHFGLGDARRIDRVVVRWPNGNEQTFENLVADRWYRLREGHQQPITWQPPTELKPLAPSELVSPPLTDRARIVLLTPVPLPELTYTDANNNHRALINGTTRVKGVTGIKGTKSARLVNLWASWCQPCLTELAEWREHAAEFEQAGLQIVTINVDQPTEATSAAPMAAANQVLDRLQLPFENGFGSEELAAKFDVVQRSLLSRQRPLPVPSSFMIDTDGRLRIVYKGPVAAETLLSDAQLMGAKPEEILAAAMPLAGHWLSPPAGSSPLQVAMKFIEGGYSDDAHQYIRMLIGESNTHPEYLSASLLNLLGAMSLDKQEVEEATAAFSQALTLDPHNRQARIELAGILLRLGKGAEAVPHFEEVLQANPDDPEMLYKLGLAHMQQGKLREAGRQMRSALDLRSHPLAHWKLAEISVGLRDAGQAILAYEAALKLKPDLMGSANNLAWLLATIDDDALRDGNRAVEVAEQVCRLQGRPTPGNLDTLAAAYAEAGQFDDAVEAAAKALKLATASKNDEFAARIRIRLKLYQQRTPFHESIDQ